MLGALFLALDLQPSPLWGNFAVVFVPGPRARRRYARPMPLASGVSRQSQAIFGLISLQSFGTAVVLFRQRLGLLLLRVVALSSTLWARRFLQRRCCRYHARPSLFLP